ncbi:MAG: diaminopimelate decarboxylase family protein [Actinomycetota bacterium]
MDARVSEPTVIDECLSIRDGHLWIEACDTVELTRRFGTPIHVVSEDHLRRNVKRITAAFRSAWPEGDVRLLPSIKANFTLALRRILTEEGTGCDTFGPGELEAALRSGVPPELISVNGSLKPPDLIVRAVEAGCRITLDSAREVELVRDAARRVGRRAAVRFRVRPDYDGLDMLTEFAEDDVTIREAAAAYKPGIPTEELLRIGPAALAADELDVVGVMAHLGRHHHSVDVWRAMGSSLAETIGTLSSVWGGWTPREIDVGGGFASPRDPTGRATRRGASRPQSDRSPSMDQYAEAVASSLRDGLVLHGVKTAGICLEAEPGRALFADAGIHLATVGNVKMQTRPIPHRWIETDTTEMFLPDGLIEHNRWTVVVASRANQPVSQSADVVGMSCGFDVIVSAAALPDIEPGDVVAILDTGAYQDAASGNFNALPRPATVLVHGDEAEVVKRSETIDDVFGRDVVPERLRGAK